MTALAAAVVEDLWCSFAPNVGDISHVLGDKIFLDHFAIITLGAGKHTLANLENLFSNLGYQRAGGGYIESKLNDFSWLNHSSNLNAHVKSALPQIVVADFRVDLLSEKVRNIINRYAISMDYEEPNINNAKTVVNLLSQRGWELPSYKDYLAVYEENQLLAWVLLNGRTINHFGVQMHLDSKFASLKEFCNSLLKQNLNIVDGVIKGSKSCGIEQASTIGTVVEVQLIGGAVFTHKPFLEFVWRHKTSGNGKMWNDYYNGFIPTNASKIIESVTL